MRKMRKISRTQYNLLKAIESLTKESEWVLRPAIAEEADVEKQTAYSALKLLASKKGFTVERLATCTNRASSWKLTDKGRAFLVSVTEDRVEDIRHPMKQPLGLCTKCLRLSEERTRMKVDKEWHLLCPVCLNPDDTVTWEDVLGGKQSSALHEVDYV